jgi:hypothetical protein
MIKQLLFTAALLAPGVAYAANPTATFSDQVVRAGSDPIACDIGPSYTGSIPAAAQAAGFTHCAANWDFSQPTYATQSNWLDCVGTNLSYTWHQGSPGVSEAECNIFQTTDPNNSALTVLHIQYKPSDYSISPIVGMQTQPQVAGQPPSFGVNNFYAEATYRIGTSCTAPNNGCGPSGGLWHWNNGANTSHIEIDDGELYGDQGGFADAGAGGVGLWQSYNHPNNLPTGWSPFNYHTYSMLVTSNGTSSMLACPYVDTTILMANCQSVNPSDPSLYSTKTWMITTAESRDGSAPNGNIDLYLQYIRVWTCAAVTPCNGSTEFTGTQNSKTLQYWH